jgi:hypothetical protein
LGGVVMNQLMLDFETWMLDAENPLADRKSPVVA